MVQFSVELPSGYSEFHFVENILVKNLLDNRKKIIHQGTNENEKLQCHEKHF